MSTSSQEGLWVLRAQCGDEEALELLLQRVQLPLRRYLRGIVGPADADDVLQEVLVLIYRKLGSLHEPERFRGWAFRIASRAAFHHLKRRRRDLEPAADIPDLEGVAAFEPHAERVEEVLIANRISPASSAVLALHFQEGMPLAEIATVLELPLGTVKSRLAAGLAKLRECLADRRNN